MYNPVRKSLIGFFFYMFCVFCSFSIFSCTSDFGKGKDALATGDKQGALVFLKKVEKSNSHFTEAQQLIQQTEAAIEQERLQREKEQKENALKESLRSSVRSSKSSSWGEPDIGDANIEAVDGTDKYVGYVVVNATESNYFTGMPQKVRYYEVWTYNTKEPNDWSFEKKVPAGDAATEDVGSVVAEAKSALSTSNNSSIKGYDRTEFRDLISGRSEDEVLKILGEPHLKTNGLFVYCFGSSSQWFTHSSSPEELIKDRDKGVRVYFLDESSRKVTKIDYIYSEIDHMCD